MHHHSLLALTAFTALALASAACSAQTVTVDGRLALTANQVETGSTTKLRELRDNASRLGFRGVEDLGGGIQASFGLEMGLSAGTGSLTDPVYRNSHVALGRLDSANPTASPLYSQIIALTSFAPNDAGANVRARFNLRGAGTVAEAEDAARSWDLGLNDQTGKLRAALGFAKDSRRGGLASNEFDDKWQAGLNYGVLPQLELYLFGGVDRYNHSATRRRDVQYSVLGTTCTLGAHKVVFNGMERDVQTALAGHSKRQS